MKIHVEAGADGAARAGARFIASVAQAAVAARGRFIMAVSGGQDPWRMFRFLASEQVSWKAVQVVQVDERVAPPGDLERNLTHLHESLFSHVPLLPEQIHAMPVDESDLEAAAGTYSQILRRIAGTPPVLDLVHLGLGPDGHTASLVPGDPVLEINDRDVAVTGVYQRRLRMTLTCPILNRARHLMWLVTGPEKAEILGRLRDRDTSIPASRISQKVAVVMTDLAAACVTDSAPKGVSCA
ncbi:MAG TPA: 6-phosphogluconolactonase [Candidatus Acidoferrales bacterium]|nr:6-phosphogluconolactonase [Candidatus Acidoferrales bacterium]